MIGYLSGEIKFVSSDSVIVDVNGVGYKLEIGNPQYLEGQDVEFFVYTHVREQELRLFGFKNSQELKLFEKLISVSGVGPKAGMALISQVGVEKIIEAITLDMPSSLKVSGVGGKTVEKIVLELKDKLEGFKYAKSSVEQSANAVKLDQYDEAVDALISLGFRKVEIEGRVKEILNQNPEIKTSQDLIKHFLKK
jgi:holliday junction DNA helicase RuvA